MDEGFEDESVDFGITPGRVVGCWTVETGDVDVLSGAEDQGFYGASHSGVKALDLNGWTAGAISRRLRTAPGRRYLLRFAFTRNPGMAGPTASGVLEIDGTRVRTIEASPRNSYHDLEWQVLEQELVAADRTTLVALRSTNPGNGGLYLDTFTLIEATR